MVEVEGFVNDRRQNTRRPTHLSQYIDTMMFSAVVVSCLVLSASAFTPSAQTRTNSAAAKETVSF